MCSNIEQTNEAIESLFKDGENSISICPYYDIETEYRAFYLDGKILLIYGKQKPYVIGDGKKDLRKLISEENLPDNYMVKENIENLNLSYIPQQGEKIEICWKHNLSSGAKPKVLEKGKLYDKIEKLAIEAGKAINIRFATIDIIQTTNKRLYVIEINSGVCTTKFSQLTDGGYEKSKDIYRKALNTIFYE